MASERSLKTLDLFAGAGGMALGFQAAGTRCVGAVEYNQPAANTFASIFAPDEPMVFGGPEHGDVNLLPVTDLLAALPSQPDLVVGGPPCQGFSRVGRGKQASLLDEIDRVRQGGVTDPARNQLYQYFLAVVRKSRPLAFVMENVPGMREQLGRDFAKAIAREAHYCGYNVRYFLLNAASYGVPQHRWRLFFVGLRSDLGHRAIPKPPPATHQAHSFLEGTALPDDPWMIAGPDIPVVEAPRPHVSVRDALGDLPRLVGHLKGQEPIEQQLDLRRAPSAYGQLLRSWPQLEARGRVSGNWYRNNTRDFRIFKLMAQGDRYPQALEIAHSLFNEYLAGLNPPPHPGSEEWCTLRDNFIPPYRNDAFHDKWRKLIADEPSWTVTAHLSRDTYSHIHYDSRQARTITVREAARLQSFPDAVDFAGNFGDQYRQIGNAVPPLLARAIAESLLAQLRELMGEQVGSAHAS